MWQPFDEGICFFSLFKKKFFFIPDFYFASKVLRSYSYECQDNNTFAQHWPSVPTQKKEDFILTYTHRRVHNTHERYDTSRQDIPSAPGLLPLSKILTKTYRLNVQYLLQYLRLRSEYKRLKVERISSRSKLRI